MTPPTSPPVLRSKAHRCGCLNDRHAFTLFEVTVVVLILTILAGAALSVSFRPGEELGVTDAVSEVVAQLRRAQSLARSGEYDVAWGVRVDPGAATLFRGVSFVSRDPTFDETISLPSGLQSSGLTEVIFNRGTGFPSTAGVLLFTLSPQDVRTITISSRGLIELEN